MAKITLTNEQITQIYRKFCKYQVVNPTSLYQFRFKITDVADQIIYLNIYQTNTLTVQGTEEGKKQFWQKTKLFWKQINCFAWSSPLINPRETRDGGQSKSESFIWGGDEAGKGDIFGSIHLTLVKNNPTLNALIIKLNLRDSKKMSDRQIFAYAPQIIHTLKQTGATYYRQTLAPTVIGSANLNALLAKKYYNLVLQTPVNERKVVIDAFCTEKKWKEYLASHPPLRKNLFLQEQAETRFYAVAIASILSRYFFLLELEEIAQIYQLKTAIKGASKRVQAIAKAVLKTNPSSKKHIKVRFLKLDN